MMAYNASKRQLEREHQEYRRVSEKRDTVYETKFNFKPNLANTRSVMNERRSSMMVLREFQLTVCLTNRVAVHPQADVQYRAFVCKGNNGLLVKSILKTRPWWTLRTYSDVDSCNLVWTEWKKVKAVNRLTSKPVRTGPGSNRLPDLGCHSKKRELALLGEKKVNNFKKLVGEHDQLWLKYDKTPQL